MAMNLFGTLVRVSQFEEPKEFDELLAQAVKKADERGVLREFLLRRASNGEQRLSEAKTAVEKIATEQDVDISVVRDQLAEFVTKRMRVSTTISGASLYQDLIYQIAERESSSRKVTQFFKKLRKTGDKSNMPRVVNEMRTAEALLQGKIRSEVGREEAIDMIFRNELAKLFRTFAQDMFAGVNRGLSNDEVLTYMAVLYDLRRLETALPTNSQMLKDNIARAIKEGIELQLLHVKCLRFTYPFGNRLELIEDLGDHLVPTKDGQRYKPVSEEQLPKRLLDVRAVFDKFGVKNRLVILLSDQDLKDYFPGEQKFYLVPKEDIQRAYESLGRYRINLQRSFGRGVEVVCLRDYLFRQGLQSAYDQKRTDLLSSFFAGGGPLPQKFLEDRINYRYESNARIFVQDPGRQFARERQYEQMASMQGLGVLRSMELPFALIEEDRGDENGFIGGVGKNALPTYFTKLRDP